MEKISNELGIINLKENKGLTWIGLYLIFQNFIFKILDMKLIKEENN